MRRSNGTLALLTCVCVLALSGCGQKSAAPDTDVASPGAAAVDAEARAAAEAKAAELAAKEQELADREAALKAEEAAAEQAKRDAEAAAAAAEAAAKKASAKPAAKPVTSTASKPTPPSPIVVPAGTQLAVALSSDVTTKKLAVGTPVAATLASPLVVGGRTAAKSGAAVHGSVTQVVSGSNKIGGVPVLGLQFDTLVAADGSTKTINASYTQQGTSETGKDTAKIVGGAAAGAIIGHQVDDDKGTVIGGLLGAGAGAMAAKKTGGEIKLTAGQVLTVATTAGFEVKP